MHRILKRSEAVAVAIVAFTLIFPLNGCASKSKTPAKPPTVQAFRVTHQLGGAHYRTIMHQGVWYQTFNTKLLVVHPEEATATDEMTFGKPGETGPAVDMAIDESIQRMYIVIEDDEVIELSIEQPRHPTFVSRVTSKELGIRPRRLSTVDGQCYVSGIGGAVRLRDRKRIYSNPNDVARIAPSANGLVACVGRQVRTIADNAYVGSASDLLAIPGTADRAGNPLLIFVIQGAEAGMVGVMSPDVRELPDPQSKTAMHGQIRRVRLIKNDLWIVGDDSILVAAIEGGQLKLKQTVNMLGARDVDLLSDNYVAICGTFGRAIYRIDTDSKGPGDVFTRTHREPGYLAQAATDGQRILAGSREGLWQYLINSRVELTRREFEQAPPPPARRAATIGATATISDDGKSLNIVGAPGTTSEAWTHAEPDGATIWSVAAIDGNFWIGHDRGITALRPQQQISSEGRQAKGASADPVLGRVRIPGRVLYVYPLLIGGGVSFVSEYGGFGVAELVDEPIAESSS